VGNVGEMAANANADTAFILDFNQAITSLSKALLLFIWVKPDAGFN